MMIEHKTFSLKAELTENRIAGLAAAYGNVDRTGDVLLPGCMAGALASFLAAGFIADTHAWEMSDVIAMPISAEERPEGLYCVAEFHSDDDSQAIRRKCMERLERGLAVGLSIGFSVGEAEMFDSGASASAWALGAGHKMAEGVGEYSQPVRVIKSVRELYEWSIVPVPMNPAAVATITKTNTISGMGDVPLDEHLAAVVDAVGEVTDRLQARKDSREAEGRHLSDQKRAQAKALAESLLVIAADPAAQVADPDVVRLLMARDLELRARMIGL